MTTAIIASPLGTPAPSLDLSPIYRAPLQPSTKQKYATEIQKMHAAGINPADHRALQQYSDTLKSSRRAFLKSALRLMYQNIEQDIKAGATPENLPQVQAALLRIDAMKSAVVIETVNGTKAHTWLSKAQVYQLTSLCPATFEGRRDYIVLGLLLGAGLRREELVSLTFENVKQQPAKNKMRTVLEIRGKGGKKRVIPIQDKLAKHLDEWRQIVGGGRVARSLGRSQELGESISAQAVYNIVNRYGVRIGIDELAPHDLRRTFAQLGYEAGVPLAQISTLLGHASVSTTQRYLNLALDLEQTASDFIPLA